VTTVTVGELIDEGAASIQTGPFGTQLKAAEYTTDGRPVLNVRNLGFGDVRANDLEFVSDETAGRLRAHILQAEDIVFGRKGAVERHAFIPVEFAGAVQGSDCIRLRLDSNRILPRFASFALRTESHLRWMQNQASHGATMASLNQEIVRRIELPELPLTTQSRVAGVLGAIDDLIKNNHRRIALLEEIAQAMYREWFVHFRYPGHEDHELVDSPFGPIPVGWNAMTLGEVAETQYGFTDSATQLSEGPKFLRVMDINKRSYISWPDVPHCSLDTPVRYSLAKGDVVIARMADPGKVGIVERDLDAVFASYLVRVRPVASWLQAYYLYFVLSAAAYQEFVLGASTGTTRKSISAKVMEAGPIVRPAEAIVDAFVKAITPLRVGITGLAQQSECLACARDLLLPVLVTGVIDVSNLDLDALLEESAA
jgi:type I restriction enzyme S subunit